jgi:hypothetical protein
MGQMAFDEGDLLLDGLRLSIPVLCIVVMGR